MTCLNFENFNNATSFLSFASIKMPKKRKRSAGLGDKEKNYTLGRSFIRKRDHDVHILYKKDCKIISNNNISAVSPEKIDEENKDDEKSSCSKRIK